MRVFVLGKVGSITHWVEDAVAGFRAAGHQVHLGVTRDPAYSRPVARLLVSPMLGVPRARWLQRALERFRPDLILAIMPYVMPPAILERIAAMPHRPPLFGWEGDVFGMASRPIADLLDVVAYTDSALVARHATLGFKPRPVFLPHAASPSAIDRVRPCASRNDRMVFVATPTPRRRRLVGEIAEPIVLYGAGWHGFEAGGHAVYPRRVGSAALAEIYASHRATLNVANELNVLGGLNQRNFTPCLSATAVLTEAQPDLERCFEPGREVLVFRDGAELDEQHARLRSDPVLATRIGENGRIRVLATHGYAQRLAELATLL